MDRRTVLVDGVVRVDEVLGRIPAMAHEKVQGERVEAVRKLNVQHMPSLLEDMEFEVRNSPG